MISSSFIRQRLNKRGWCVCNSADTQTHTHTHADKCTWRAYWQWGFPCRSVQWVKYQPPDAASHHRQDLSGRWRETPHQQLEARWLFHVFMSHWRSIKPDRHSLGPILFVCAFDPHPPVRERERQSQRTACMYSSVPDKYCMAEYTITFYIIFVAPVSILGVT